ncbi:MAG: MFS transporter [Kosmotoga sp.]|nr:MAG: MFS transporter [Kosmotoga sp.]
MNKDVRYLLSYTAITGTTVAMFRVLFNLYLRDAGYSNSVIGSTQSAALWGTAIIGLLMGIMADALGRKRMMIYTTFLMPLVAIMMTFNVSVPILLTLSFFRGGFTAARFTIVLAAFTTSTDSKSRAKAFGANFGLMMGSGVFGNFIGGLLGDIIGLRITLILSMILTFAALIPLFKLEPDKIKTERVNPFDFSGFDKQQKKIMVLFFVSTATVGFGAGLFIHFGNLIFKDLFGMTPTGIGIALSIAQLGTALGSTFSHILGKTFGPLKFVLTMQILVVPLILSFAFIRDPYAFTVVYALRFVFMNTTVPIMNSVVFSHLPSDKLSTISGMNGFLNNSVRAVAALLFGVIVGASISGYTTLFILSTVFYGASAFIAFLIYKSYENLETTKNLFDR